MKHSPLSPEERGTLVSFLSSPDVPETTMGIYELEGFLVAVVIGPKTLVPSAFIGEIWGSDEGYAWKDLKEAQKIMDLLFRLYNYLVGVFDDDPGRFQPSIPKVNLGGEKHLDPKSWCNGFLKGVELARNEWNPLFKDKEESLFLAPFLVFGTTDGYTLLANDPGGPEVLDHMAEKIGASVRAIYNYWLPTRRSGPSSFSSNSPKEGPSQTPETPNRNDPCPCGSGKKFKHCHGGDL